MIKGSTEQEETSVNKGVINSRAPQIQEAKTDRIEKIQPL